MIKLFSFMSLFLLSNAYARECKVYGISDGPQKLDCSFKDLKLSLRCKHGLYYINSSRVISAYHLDVEDGPSPLVFKTRGLELTVILNPKIDIEAELSRKGRIDSGSCL